MKSLLDFFFFFVSFLPRFFNVLHFDGDDVVILGLIFLFRFLFPCFRHDLYDTHMFRCFELVLVFPLVDLRMWRGVATGLLLSLLFYGCRKDSFII